MVTQHIQSHLLQLELGRYNFFKNIFAKVLKTFFFKTNSQFVALFKNKMVRNFRDNFFVSTLGGAFQSFISMKDPYREREIYRESERQRERERMNICALFEVLKFWMLSKMSTADGYLRIKALPIWTNYQTSEQEVLREFNFFFKLKMIRKSSGLLSTQGIFKK